MLFVLIFVHDHGLAISRLGCDARTEARFSSTSAMCLRLASYQRVFFYTTVFVLHPGGVCDFAIVSGSWH